MIGNEMVAGGSSFLLDVIAVVVIIILAVAFVRVRHRHKNEERLLREKIAAFEEEEQKNKQTL